MADIDVVNSKIESLTTEAQSLRTKIKSIANKYDVLITDDDTPETMLDKIVDEVEPKKTVRTGFKYKRCYALEMLFNNMYYINAETLGAIGIDNTYNGGNFKNYALANNTKLNAVNLNNLPVSGFNVSQYCFASCTNLENFEASDGKLGTIYGYAFDSCTKLKNVKINCSNIYDYAFNGCSALTSLTITNTTPPTLQANAFASSAIASGTATIYVPSSAVATYQAASGWSTYSSQIAPYYVPTPEEYLNISNGVCSGFTTAGQAAYDNNQITTLVFPDTVTSIANNAFENKTRLATVYFPASITSIGSSAFNGCSNVTKVAVSSIDDWLNTTLTNVTSSPLYYAKHIYIGGNEITSVVANNVTNIPVGAFYNCASITSISLPSTVTNISPSAFYGCSGLTGITIQATTPPTLSATNSFYDTNDCPIYVPSASVTAYQTANIWSNFASRIQAIQP